MTRSRSFALGVGFGIAVFVCGTALAAANGIFGNRRADRVGTFEAIVEHAKAPAPGPAARPHAPATASSTPVSSAPTSHPTVSSPRGASHPPTFVTLPPSTNTVLLPPNSATSPPATATATTAAPQPAAPHILTTVDDHLDGGTNSGPDD